MSRMTRSAFQRRMIQLERRTSAKQDQTSVTMAKAMKRDYIEDFEKDNGKDSECQSGQVPSEKPDDETDDEVCLEENQSIENGFSGPFARDSYSGSTAGNRGYQKSGTSIRGMPQNDGDERRYKNGNRAMKPSRRSTFGKKQPRNASKKLLHETAGNNGARKASSNASPVPNLEASANRDKEGNEIPVPAVSNKLRKRNGTKANKAKKSTHTSVPFSSRD
ncbi:hypothetical protein FGB62_208g011 [Gracilaria domingensis]|nr:hypothetical protein FGB62_208g011 [Gracilaria domingensis]